MRGVEGEQAGNDTTRSATQVCLRRVESCLGGHEAGVFGDDEGVGNTSLPIRKRRRTDGSEHATFSGFIGIENQNDNENQNG